MSLNLINPKYNAIIANLIALFLLLGMQTAKAFEASNIQVLYGNNFNGDVFIYDTVDGKKTTITLEHFRTWQYGDLFTFADLMWGEKFNGDQQENYLEIGPRLSLSKLTQSNLGSGALTDIYIASQLNIGQDYDAWLLGIGSDWQVPYFNFVQLNLYHKRDNYDLKSYQVTMAYQSQSWQNWMLEGFFDLTDRDLNSHNQILYNLASSNKPFYIGVEWIHYDYNFQGVKSNTDALQIMARYPF